MANLAYAVETSLPTGGLKAEVRTWPNLTSSVQIKYHGVV